MHTNHNSVCLINIDLIIIFDLFFFIISYKNKTYLFDGLHCICFYFDLLAQIYPT